MGDLHLPIVAPRPFAQLEPWLRYIHQRSRIAAFFFGDMHLWARDRTNNSALVYRALQSIEAIITEETCGPEAVVPQLPVWITIGDTLDSAKAHRRSEHDALVEEMLEQYAGNGLLAIVTGNHDHEVIARPHDVARQQRERPNKKRGIVRDLSWLAALTLPNITTLVIAHDQVYLGPAAVTTGLVTDLLYAELGVPPNYADLLVLHIGGKLFLVRHGDLYDTWYHRHPSMGDIPKRLKHNLAHLGSEVYEGIGWLRKRLKHIGVHVKGAENRVKEWFNAEMRTVVLDIAYGLSKEAGTIQAIHRMPIGGTVAGHTHTPIYAEYAGCMHCNPGHSRGDVGLGIITEDGTLHEPFIIADDR